MRYVLMEATNGQILMVENNTIEGLEKVENLVGEGCKYVGTVDTDYSVGQLLAGFNKDSSFLIEQLQGKLEKIRKVMEE